MEVTFTLPSDPALAALQKQVEALTAQVEELKPHPVPLYEQWVGQVLMYADQYGAALLDTTLPPAERLDRCYYDAAFIYHNLAAYFNRPDYLKVRDEAVKIYRDGYVLSQPKPGQVAGWMIFPHGLVAHYNATGDEASKRAVLLMSENAAYGQAGEPIATWLKPAWMSREAAYNLMADVFARDLGGVGAGVEELTEICLGHLTEWRSLLDGCITPTNQQDCRCFMVGLTASALIERVSRENVPPELKQRVHDELLETFNLLWDTMYVPAAKAMKYTDRALAGVGDTSPAPDVSMLIAPAYAWLGQRDRADTLFTGSVTGAYWQGHKQFNQTLRWTFDYLKWRQ